MRRRVQFGVIALLVLVGSPAWGASRPATEPSGTQPSAAVRSVLEEAERLLGEGKPAEALSAAARARDAATSESDLVGEAHAHRLRARCQEALAQPDSALRAWREAASLWERLGESPERVEALGAEAVLLDEDDSLAVSRLVDSALALAVPESPRPLAMVSALNSASLRAYRKSRPRIAERFASQALALGERVSPRSLETSASLSTLADLAMDREDWKSATEYEQRSLTIREQIAPGSLDVAGSLNSLGIIAWNLGDLDAAADYYRRSLAIRERVAPGSLLVATSLNNLGNASFQRGDLAAARDRYLAALAIREKLAPGSGEVAASLNNLGNVALTAGDLDGGWEYHTRALAIREALAPGSLQVAASLSNLGVIAASQGDLGTARDYHLRALTIRERLAPGTSLVAVSLEGLGLVAGDLGDYDASREYLTRALTLQERLAPGSPAVARTLNNLGETARRQGDLADAQGHFTRALAIREKLSPGSLDVASTLNNIGNVALLRGDYRTAQACYERALAMEETHAPGSLEVAATLTNLAAVAEDRGDLAAARDQCLHALAIEERLAPGALEVAASLKNIGKLSRSLGELPEAEAYLTRAWGIVQEHYRAVAGDEASRAFTGSHADYAAALVRVRLEEDRKAEAFQALEEGRAQGLLRLLSERGIAAAVGDSALWARYDAAEEALEAASQILADAGVEEARLASGRADDSSSTANRTAVAGSALAAAKERRDDAFSAYTKARLEQEQTLAEIRHAVPGAEPRAYSFEESRRILPPGSALLAWAVGEDQSAVFVIPADTTQAISADTIAVGETRLGEQVLRLRELIGAGSGARGLGGLAEAGESSADADLVSASRTLFALLVPPSTRSAVEAAERVILCPDGPLWELPFAALVTNASGPPAWFGLRKPLSYTASLTVLAQERPAVHAAAAPQQEALIVGDPSLESGKPGSGARVAGSPLAVARGEERSYLMPDGILPPPLPASAEEARRIAALYGVAPLIGEAATEAAVRQRISQAGVVHLATHGYFNPDLAMSSGILLTPPAGEPGVGERDNDGALQAWEFGRQLPLRAEVVVLSACESGRGEKARGEGLVGLTRALQGAGARSVVATQWKVADQSTAALMVSFHKKLRQGFAKDEALRRAMAEVAGQRATRDPFYWAPFFLTGDADRPLALAR